MMNLDNITVNAQSSIKIKGSKTLYFDAFKIEEEMHDGDLIFVTHDHFDHFDVKSINKIKNDKSKIIAPESIKENILKEFDNECIFLKPGDKLEIDDLKIEAIASYNISKPFHSLDKGYIGYLVKMDNMTYFVCGDSDENADNLKVKCDVALVPIGGTFTMDPLEAASYINNIKPKYAIPTHYGEEVGSFSDGDNFKSRVNSQIDVVFKLS